MSSSYHIELWSCIWRGATEGGEVLVCLLQPGGEAEVPQEDVISPGEENVLRLDVPVDQTAAVHIVDSAADLLEYHSSPVFRELSWNISRNICWPQYDPKRINDCLSPELEIFLKRSPPSPYSITKNSYKGSFSKTI